MRFSRREIGIGLSNYISNMICVCVSVLKDLANLMLILYTVAFGGRVHITLPRQITLRNKIPLKFF